MATRARRSRKVTTAPVSTPTVVWTAVPQHALLFGCDRCGGAFVETDKEAHERWHADLEVRTLPKLGEFFLDLPEQMSA